MSLTDTTIRNAKPGITPAGKKPPNPTNWATPAACIWKLPPVGASGGG